MKRVNKQKCVKGDVCHLTAPTSVCLVCCWALHFCSSVLGKIYLPIKDVSKLWGRRDPGMWSVGKLGFFFMFLFRFVSSLRYVVSLLYQ